MYLRIWLSVSLIDMDVLYFSINYCQYKVIFGFKTNQVFIV